MKCPNCSAEYDDTLPKCPFCQAENPHFIKAVKKEILHSLSEEKQNIEQLPEKVVKTTTSKLLRLVPLLLGILIFILIATFIGSKIKVAEKNRKNAAAKEELESCYERGEYDKLLDIFFNSDLSTYDYEKYYVVGSVASDYGFFSNFTESVHTIFSIQDSGKDIRLDSIHSALESGIDGLVYLDEQLSGAAPKSCYTVLEEYKKAYLQDLQTLFSLSEEDIDLLKKAVSEEDTELLTEYDNMIFETLSK